jgi:hypothetical protein
MYCKHFTERYHRSSLHKQFAYTVKGECVFKYFLTALLNLAFSLLRNVRLCGKLSKILMFENKIDWRLVHKDGLIVCINIVYRHVCSKIFLITDDEVH